MRAMTSAADSYDQDAMEAAIALSDAIERTISLARTMLDRGQPVDLTGLDGRIGLLCAKSLDLPPAMGRTMRPRLTSVLDALDEMTLVLNRQNAG